MALACVYPDPRRFPHGGPRLHSSAHRRRSSVGQSTALVKRGSRVRIPPSAWLCRAESRLFALLVLRTRVQNAYIGTTDRPPRLGDRGRGGLSLGGIELLEGVRLRLEALLRR